MIKFNLYICYSKRLTTITDKSVRTCHNKSYMNMMSIFSKEHHILVFFL